MIFNETGPGFTCQLDNILGTVIFQNLLRRMPHKKRELMLQTTAVMAAANIDVRAAVPIHVRQRRTSAYASHQDRNDI